MYFSLIIPIYNRPEEIDELLFSLQKQTYKEQYEIVIVEDGSSITCKHIIEKYDDLNISYYFKLNSGPGDSRNYGMKVAKGNYFVILDSDCIIPENYLDEVNNALKMNYVDCFGGPDAALNSFSNIQKAINFTMTSFITTGGIRGGSEKLDKFQPRSFNMGLSKKAFELSKGFGNIHPGEDPDLSIRLWEMGYDTKLFSKAFVYHKRRINWIKFYTQVHKFGIARPILDKWYPKYAKITYWFPTLFLIGFVFSVLLYFLKFPYLLFLFVLYYVILFTLSLIQNKSLSIAFYSLIAAVIQFYGYGKGFLTSYYKIHLLNMIPENAFPKMFFKK